MPLSLPFISLSLHPSSLPLFRHIPRLNPFAIYLLLFTPLAFSSDAYSLTSAESVGGSFHNTRQRDHLHCPTPTITAESAEQDQSCEAIMADVLEKLRRLNQQESRKQSASHSPGSTHSGSGSGTLPEGSPEGGHAHGWAGPRMAEVEVVCPAPEELRDKLARLDLDQVGAEPAGGKVGVGQEREEEEVVAVQQMQRSPRQLSMPVISPGGGDCEQRKEEEEEEEVGTRRGGMDGNVAMPTHSLSPRNIAEEPEIHVTQPRGLAPPPSHTASSSTSAPYHHQPPSSPPLWGTPLAARNGSYPLHPDIAGKPYLLHPDVLAQQFSPDISLLPVPRIVCPGTGGSSGRSLEAASFGILGGGSGGSNEYTLDENVYHADMITLKYLGAENLRNLRHPRPSASRGHLQPQHGSLETEGEGVATARLLLGGMVRCEDLLSSELKIPFPPPPPFLPPIQLFGKCYVD